MSSRRELIIQDIVETLKNQQTIRLGVVTRDPGIELQDLAKTAFPAVIVESGAEIRESITQMGAGQQRQATMSVNMSVWIGSNTQADSQLNDLIEKIEELLEVDTTRGGQAIDTQLVEIETDTDTAPYASMNLIFQVQYIYTKGNP